MAAEQVSPFDSKMGNFKSAVSTLSDGLLSDHSKRKDRFTTYAGHQAPSEPDGFRTVESRRLMSARAIWTPEDFEFRKVIGEGTFGVVYMAQLRETKKYCALKQMKKAAYPRKNNRDRIYGEREVLAESKSRWIVDLFCTFQDADNVYMAMEFLQGGDLVCHLLAKRRFSVEETRFYIAELLEALDVVHAYGFVHRDVKPDNTVLSSAGHLKLLDFGLCRPDDDLAVQDLQPERRTSGNRRRERLKSVVGTPEYMAPETFTGAYGAEADVWSVGVITFELLVGITPFQAGKMPDGNLVQGRLKIKILKQKILQHESEFPPMLQRATRRNFVPPDAERFLQNMVCDRSHRLSIEQCRTEAFFCGLDFKRLHLMRPPIVPEISGPSDTRHFEDFEDTEPRDSNASISRRDSNIDWANYEYDQDQQFDVEDAGTSSQEQPKRRLAPTPPETPAPQGSRASQPDLQRRYVEFERQVASPFPGAAPELQRTS